jgi:hypothetical protein
MKTYLSILAALTAFAYAASWLWIALGWPDLACL